VGARSVVVELNGCFALPKCHQTKVCAQQRRQTDCLPLRCSSILCQPRFWSVCHPLLAQQQFTPGVLALLRMLCTPVGIVKVRTFYARICYNISSSIMCLKVLINSAPSAPLTMRWSKLPVTVHAVLIVIRCCASMCRRFSILPTAMIPA